MLTSKSAADVDGKQNGTESVSAGTFLYPSEYTMVRRFVHKVSRSSRGQSIGAIRWNGDSPPLQWAPKQSNLGPWTHHLPTVGRYIEGKED